MPHPHPFGLYIVEQRKKRDVSRAALARELGITATYLGEVESGARGPLGEKYYAALKYQIGCTHKRLRDLSEISRPLKIELGQMGAADARAVKTIVDAIRSGVKIPPEALEHLMEGT
jgi:transcriptional regulator with XRE-family HTH domain